MLSAVHRCSIQCKCYADVHIWARHIRANGGEIGQLKEVLKKKSECHAGKRLENRSVKTELNMSWTEVTKNINYFDQIFGHKMY